MQIILLACCFDCITLLFCIPPQAPLFSNTSNLSFCFSFSQPSQLIFSRSVSRSVLLLISQHHPPVGFLNQLLYASSLIVLHAYRGFSEISALGIHALKPFLSGLTDGLRTVVLHSGEGRK